MLASTTAVRSFFTSVTRVRGGQQELVAKHSTSFKQQVLSKQVETNMKSLEKNFNKDLKLGVLFLNLGGPETLKVCE